MEDDVVLAKRHTSFVMVSLHVHDLSHDRSFGYPDISPPNDTIEYRSAIDAGADIVFGNGPHVLRGIEFYKGRPIFYSLATSSTSTAPQRRFPSISFISGTRRSSGRRMFLCTIDAIRVRRWRAFSSA